MKLVFIRRCLCRRCPRCVSSPCEDLGGSAELEHTLALHSPSPCFTQALLKSEVCPRAAASLQAPLEHPSDEAERCQGISAGPAGKQAL